MSLRRKIGLLMLALLLLTPSAGLYYVATTESGLQFVARQLGQRQLGPVHLTIGEVRGSLVGGFHVDSLRVQHRLADIQVGEVSGRLQLLPLLALQRISLPELQVTQATVALLRDPVENPLRPPRFLPPALRIDAQALQVGKVVLTLVSGRQIDFRAISGGVTILPTQIRVRSTQLELEQLALVADGRVRAARPSAFDGEIEAHWQPENQPLWQFVARFDGDVDRLPLRLDILQPFRAHVDGTAETLNRGWTFAGNADVSDVDLRDFGGGNALGILSAQLAVTASADGFTARGDVTPPGLQAGQFRLDFSGAYADRRLTIRQATAVHPPSRARATVRGSVDLVPGGPQLDLAGEWTTFRWPLAAATPAFRSAHGRFSMTGLKPWNVEGEGEVEAVGLTMPATLRGQLGTDALAIESATVETYGGSARFAGEARWQPAEQWRVAGRMSGFDTQRLRPDLPGELDFDFRAEGAPFGDDALIDVSLANVSGTLRGQEAGGTGRFIRPAGSADWRFDDVDVRLGSTHVQLDGGFGTHSDLTFAIDADDLSLFDPDARGRVTARGRYAGTAEAPVLLFKARGTGFEWQGQRLESLDADVDLDLQSGGRAQGLVEMTGLQLGARTVEQVTLNLSGDTTRQHIALDVQAAPLRIALTTRGNLQDGAWLGEMQSLSITDAANLALQLESPAALHMSMERLELGQLCVRGDQERLCGSANRLGDGTWSTVFSAESLPLHTLTAGLTQNIHYEGTINLLGTLAGRAGELPTGTLRGELNQAQLRHVLGNGREERMNLGSGRVSGEATPEGFSVQVGLNAGDSGSIRGELTGEHGAGDWRDFPIRGSLDARTDGLALLDIYVGEIDKATGQLSTRVNIGGTLGEPTIEGLLQLRDASIDIYQVNLMLRELSLDARFDATALDLSGQSRLGDGIAHFNGRLAWRDAEPYGDLHVEGERLLIVNVPEARIEASPKLDFKLSGRRIDATGEVLLPYARLEPADLTSAVLASSDEVLVDAPPADPAQRWTVVSNIRLVLGDQVSIDSLGLTARLGGSIEVRTDEAQTTRGQGELNIAEGRYAALGRLLDIERGRLIFNNVPLGDPGVDMRAQKVFPDVTAGVNVRGSLRAPRLTFYSEPAIPQSQIASLILAGGSLESVQDNQGAGAARNDLLAQGTAILAQRVAPRVGVDDVGIESDMSNDTSLVLGKYLSPRLYVSYGISLAEAINTLKLRYTIGDHWTIKTEAGKARSADIVYTLQKK